MAIKLIYNHIEHHASHSGYDQMAKYVAADAYQEGLFFKLFQKLPKKIVDKIPATKTPWYWGKALPRELEMCVRSLIPKKTLYHFFYAENDLRLSSRFRPRWNNKIVASFHQPPEFLETHVADKNYIRGLDAAIVVSEYQIPYMARFLPYDRIFCVPHGVDTKYWHPDPSVAKAQRPTFLFVGFWLRDVEMFAATVRRAAEVGLDACFRVVTFAEHRKHFEALPNTVVLSAISDEALLHEYRSAHAIYLPLKHATANNAILETMSCGTAVVTTQSGGVVEYIDEHCGVAVPSGDIEAAVAALRSIAGDKARMLSMGAAARRRTEKYSWEIVGEQMNYVYRRILGSSCKKYFHQTEDKPRNICLLTEEYPPETGWGGIATYGYNLAQGLAGAGHRVIVISGCVGKPSITVRDNVEVHTVKFEPKAGWKKRFWEKHIVPRLKKYPELQRRIEFSLAARKRFRHLYNRIPIHLIESPEYFGSVYAIQWLRKRCPTMIKLHTPSEVNCWVNDIPVSKDIKLSNILEKGSTKRADKITAPSRKIIDIVTKRWLPGIQGIEHLEYPIDTTIYSPGPGRVTPRKHFLYTGRLEHRKGVHLLVEAFARVAKDIPDLDLHLAGHDTPTFARDGQKGMRFLEWMEGAAIAPEVRSRIEFLGRIPLRDLIPLYRGAFACIIPSTSFENFPNSCLEAIACGKAVIVSDAGGMVEMVSHMESGIHVKANDVDSLAEAIRYMAQHPEETAKFGQRAREIVLERYATDKIVARTMKVFNGVIAGGKYR